MKKILYITYDGLTDPLGQSQILPYLKGLSQCGFQFTVLSFEKKDRFQREGELVRDIVNDTNIKWHPLWFTSKPPFLSKIIDRQKLKRAALRLYHKEKFEMIHCRSYVAAEIGLKFKKRFGTKFLFDMRGFWADERIDSGQWNKRNFFYRQVYKYYKKREKDFLANADEIISLTHEAQNYLLAKEEYQHIKIEVIPCCSDLDYFDYHSVSVEEVTIVKRELDVSNNVKLITYSGSTSGTYLIDEMFSFFKILTEQKPEYIMLVLTKDDVEKIKRKAMMREIPVNKIRIVYSPRNKMPQYLAASNFGIFFIKNSFSKMASSPTKHGELMGMGIPVICNNIGDTGSIVNATKTGIVCNKFDQSSFQKVIDEMSYFEKMDKEKIRQNAIKFFDLGKAIQKYEQVYKRILSA